MLTFTEIVLNLTIWVLCVAGLFFGLRAAWRRRRHRQQPHDRRDSPPARPKDRDD